VGRVNWTRARHDGWTASAVLRSLPATIVSCAHNTAAVAAVWLSL